MATLGIQTDFGQLRKVKVIDVDGIDVGKVIDFVVDQDFKLSKFILGGSFIEELKERIGLKVDDDPVVSLESIDQTGTPVVNQVQLTIKAEELSNKLDPKAIGSDEYVFSQLSKYDVVSNKGDRIGKIVDALLAKDGLTSFVLGERALVEFFERVGLIGNYDLLIPPKCIAKIQDQEIRITSSKEELKLLLNNEEIGNKEIFNHSTIGHTKGLAHVSRYNRNY
ncbi:MAG: hypothetical protein ACW98K_11345 [Candidatus Kariarchaeaceae archaeon]|jgi:sporulation protein YlmC with PRC-barrel domain